MPNIWHLTHQIPLFKPYKVFQMCQNFATCYNTVSNMRWYGHQCQKYFGLYNYFSLSSHQISLSLSATHLSLFVFGSLITDLTTPRHWPPCHADLFDLVDLISSRHTCLWVCAGVVVGVVAAVIVSGRCCSSGGCTVVVVDVDDREELIYYFNM